MTIKNNSLDKRLVIVGNGMVAGRFVDELIKRGFNPKQITVFGEEPEGSYNRILLSSVVAGDASSASIIQKDVKWYHERGIAFVSARVETIDRAKQVIHSASGEQCEYDHLVLATGSRSAQIPAQADCNVTNLKGIFPFRTLQHTRQMIARASQAQEAIVVGGGLLGLEAAYGLAKQGVKVSLIHRSRWLLNRQLDQNAGAMLQAVMEKLGICFYLQNEVARFEGDSELTSVSLKDGTRILAQMAVIATGVTPNIELGRDCDLACNRAIVVDDYMSTNDPAISAIGECAEHNGKTFGLVDPLWRHAQSLADRIVLDKLTPFVDAPIATKLKVSGVNVYSAGKVLVEQGDREMIIRDERSHIYRKLIISDGVITGVVLFGDVNSGNGYFDLMMAKENVDSLLPNLVVGEAFVDVDRMLEKGAA